MTYTNVEEAWEAWRAEYYESGKGYEGIGRSFEDQVDMFKDWVEDNEVTYGDPWKGVF
jgi:hypothetical protein